ncbi:hypothetical protein DY138_00610 [Apilactobacillus timberlakei]|uniref:hypothetical protein n=1 Tax=Apilactobacillus timberlakei TaxID=2008380 RepID=UPI00112DFCD2|nr:hypothetical protein [Apilactobacillus timberlakei]TPR19971.1 hypothetical protein DY138_00610 [Apilactobacillus timberlakei]TPR21689.1 hypothetical protein DY061_00525 [Apilactobacillus timberlakei]TPR22935.1 hypothetical protein DY083_02345 [Apilactobacillus timberlakei]
MQRHVRKMVEKMLFDYPKIDEYVKQRVEEIKNPFDEFKDENVGGGKSNKTTLAVENLVISIDEDKTLNALNKQKSAVESAIKSLEPTFYKIFSRYYFRNEARYKTLQGLAMEYHISKSLLYKERDSLFADILKNMNLYYLCKKI